MSNEVSLEEFNQLLLFAQNSHWSKNEPIPALSLFQVGKLESCLRTPFQEIFGTELYPDFLDKASILFYLLVKNHPLQNGNKRMACLTLAYFCEVNDIDLIISPSDFYELALNTAKSFDKDTCIGYIKDELQKNLVNNRTM